ncbi:MAG: hypothetical protein LIR50_11645 [Bacillota bacterium]|nr:hypothetical protein [Bacillota bacterium]
MLYEVTSAIASGETITPGTNVVAKTVTDIIDETNTEISNEKISLIADHSISGSAGWYKFFEYTIPVGSSSKFRLLITETYQSNRSGIWSIYLNNSPTAGLTTTVNLLDGGSTYTYDNLYYNLSGNVFSLYLNKHSNDNGLANIQVISSFNRDGTLFDLSSYWTSTSVAELPSTAIVSTNKPSVTKNPTLRITGSPGWYKFFEYPLDNGTAISFMLSITFTGSTGRAGILTGGFTTNSNGTLTYSGLNWLTLDGLYSLDRVRWEFSNGILYLYIEKTISASYSMNVYILSG